MHLEILIREIREQKNIKLEELANRAGISKSNLSKIERGEVLPSLLTAVQIAKALKTDIKELYREVN